MIVNSVWDLMVESCGILKKTFLQYRIKGILNLKCTLQYSTDRCTQYSIHKVSIQTITELLSTW